MKVAKQQFTRRGSGQWCCNANECLQNQSYAQLWVWSSVPGALQCSNTACKLIKGLGFYGCEPLFDMHFGSQITV